MIVFVVLSGEAHEGGFIDGIYADKAKAVQAALKTHKAFKGEWVPSEQDKDVWFNGCDFVAVETHEVQ